MCTECLLQFLCCFSLYSLIVSLLPFTVNKGEYSSLYVRNRSVENVHSGSRTTTVGCTCTKTTLCVGLDSWQRYRCCNALALFHLLSCWCKRSCANSYWPTRFWVCVGNTARNHRSRHEVMLHSDCARVAIVSSPVSCRTGFRFSRRNHVRDTTGPLSS